MVALLGITYHPQAWRRAQLRVDVGQLRARKELQASPGRGGEAGRVRALPRGAPASDHNAASSPASVRADPDPRGSTIVARCHGPRRPKTRCVVSSRARILEWLGCVASCGGCRPRLTANSARRPSRVPPGPCCGMWGSPASPATRRYAARASRTSNKLGVFGAEIAVSLLFADIHGSTGIAERMSPTEFRATSTASTASPRGDLDHDGIVDKFVGDEAIGLFFIGVSGPHHTAAAIAAARALLDAVGHADATTAEPSPSAPRCTPATPSSVRPGPRERSTTSRRSATCEHDGTSGERGGGRGAPGLDQFR